MQSFSKLALFVVVDSKQETRVTRQLLGQEVKKRYSRTRRMQMKTEWMRVRAELLLIQRKKKYRLMLLLSQQKKKKKKQHSIL